MASTSVPPCDSPLQRFQKRADSFKKAIDIFKHDVEESTEDFPKFQVRFQELKNEGNELQKSLSLLQKKDEPAPVSRYDDKKTDEVRRLIRLQTEVELFGEKFQASNNNERPGKHLDKSASQNDVQNSEESASEEYSESEEDTAEDEERGKCENTTIKLPYLKWCIGLSDYEAKEANDLSFKKGDVLEILEERTDGWWKAKNIDNNQGMVPSTYLQFHTQSDLRQPNTSCETQEQCDNDSEESSDESEEWRSGSHQEIKSYKSKDESSSKSPQKVKHENSSMNILSIGDCFPAGFHPSVLHQMSEQDERHKSSSYILPALSESQLAFHDLHWDAEHNSIKQKLVRVSRQFMVWNCRMIPCPGRNVEILRRQVRLCAFDGHKVLSNIHTIRATWQSKEPKIWTFSPKVDGILPSLLDGECFIRCNSLAPELGILFELGVTCFHTETRQQAELSCGWAFLKLFDDSGVPIANRTYELLLQSGTPFQDGLVVNHSLGRSAKSNVISQMLSSSKESKLLLKMKLSSKGMKESMNFLPETLLSCSCYVQMIIMFRQVLGDVLIKERSNAQNAELIASPMLASLPALMNAPDILDALRSTYSEKLKNLKSHEKCNQEVLKSTFKIVYHDTVLRLLSLPYLASTSFTGSLEEGNRWKMISLALQQNRDKIGSLGHLLSPEHSYLPFSVSEMTFDMSHIGV
uniref:Nephronophthisis 1 n=1 Tax=Eptatretus burgeri TaxID=7764 RepID=A0A8C4PXC5_EPTBU